VQPNSRSSRFSHEHCRTAQTFSAIKLKFAHQRHCSRALLKSPKMPSSPSIPVNESAVNPKTRRPDIQHDMPWPSGSFHFRSTPLQPRNRLQRTSVLPRGMSPQRHRDTKVWRHMRDPDGFLIEVGQTTMTAGPLDSYVSLSLTRIGIPYW
jgi:hypothetical protein